MPASWSRLVRVALGMPLLLALLVACGAGGNPNGAPVATGSTIIKIATDFPVSGQDSIYGKPAENGAHLAVDEANQNNFLPGYKFVFLPKNDAGSQGVHDPATGLKNINDAISDALVAGVVGPFNNNVAQSILPATNQAPILLMSPSNSNDCLTQTTPESECGSANNKIPAYRPTGKVTYFRIATLDQYQGGALAKFAFKSKGYRKAYVVDDGGIAGIRLADAFTLSWTTLGGSIAGRTSAPNSPSSFTDILTQIAA